MTTRPVLTRSAKRRISQAATLVIVCVLIAILAGRPLLSCLAVLGVTFGWS